MSHCSLQSIKNGTQIYLIELIKKINQDNQANLRPIPKAV